MNRLSVICMAALLLLTVSCKKDKQETGNGFRATTETQSGSSKTHLGDGSDADHKGVLWDSEDIIKVFNKDHQAVTFKATSVNGKNALFEGTETIDPSFFTAPYTAFFPSDNVTLDNSNFKLTLSGSQTYNPQNGYGLTSTAYPMMAVSDDKDLNFKNICSIIEFNLTSATTCTLQSITLTSNKTDEMLYGTGIVNWNGGNPTLGTLSGGGNSITLSCNGAELNSTAKSFYFVVPAGTLSQGFTVKVIDTENKEWSREASATIVGRNQVFSFISDVATAPVVPSVSIAYVDGVVLNCSVGFEAGSHSCEYGLVYGTIATPTISDGKVVVHNSSDPAISQVNFIGNIGIQAVETSYNVRAYCIIGGETYYSESAQTVKGGAIPHRFKVDGNRYVYFSQGNLWANRNDLTNLHFESNQYSYNKSYDAAHVSRFFWSNNSNDASNIKITVKPSGNHFTLQSGFKANGEADTWRVMTAAEWSYLINNHTCAVGKVNGEAGLIILCDGFSYPEGCSTLNPTCGNGSTLPVNTGYPDNNYDVTSWSKMEANGALFLPAAGRRNGGTGGEGNIGTEGLYTSSSLGGTDGTDNLGLSFPFVNPPHNVLYANGEIAFNRGHALRLVRTVGNY